MTNPRIPDYDAIPDGLLVLPHLRAQNVNAISSPHTWGFPAPTALLGFVHALQRKLASDNSPYFGGVGIICHGFATQSFKPNRRQHHIFIQSRNPVYLKRDIAKFIDKGTLPAIVEEGRAHVELSLVIALHNDPFDEDWERDEFARKTAEIAHSLRLAGGSLLPPDPHTAQAEWIVWPSTESGQLKMFRRFRRRLLPGFALVHRPDLLGTHLELLRTKHSDAQVLDALLDLTSLNHKPTIPDDNEIPPDHVEWQIERRPGWLVPLPVGFAGISELHAPGTVANTRDLETPFRFVESLLSLGQWISPHRLTQLEQMLWHYSSNAEAGLYRVINRYAEQPASAFLHSEFQGK